MNPAEAGEPVSDSRVSASFVSALRPVLLAWLLLAAVTASLAVHARYAAPAGTEFSGTFYYADDFYNYLASVEQAQHGALVFRSKLAVWSRNPDRPCGHRPQADYR